jgi:enoyl-CoA hydratase/carnithine racemase
VADPSAVFGLPEVGIGIVPSSGGTYRLVRTVGAARAKELLLLRDRFGADEALGFGLVTVVVREGQATARAIEMGNELGTLPPLAVEVAKRAVDAAAGSSRDAGLLIERLAYGMLAQTEDHAEATAAFEERRDPQS